MTYYCGWDGGGSKTNVCITDECGVVLSEKTFGPINLNGTSEDTVRESVRSCVDFMKSFTGSLTDCKGLVIGMAGVSNHATADFVQNTVRVYGYNGKLQLLGDHETALHGAINGHGAILIAGTGSVCFGRDKNGENFRCGGYGHLIDDEGSGYAIGRDILIAVTHAYDGRGPETCLSEYVYENLDIRNHNSMISWLYSPETDKKQIAALAPLLLPALAQNDTAALQIAEKAAKHLASLVISGMKKADIKTGEVALMGSILTHYDSIRNKVSELIKNELPQINIINPRNRPEKGAADLARELFM